MSGCVKKLQQDVQQKSRGEYSGDRKARAEHLIRCSLMQVKKKAKIKPLTELCGKGHPTEDRPEWQKDLQRHCEEV